MLIENFNLANTGKYICNAQNTMGNVSKEVNISIKFAPKVEVSPNILKLQTGAVGSLECSIQNTDGDFKIIWQDGVDQKDENVGSFFKRFSKYLSLNCIKQKKEFAFTATRHDNNKLISCVVKNGEFEITSNSTIIVEYAPDFNMSTNGASIRRKARHGISIKLNCESNENPEATASWFFSSKLTKRREKINFNLKSIQLPKMNSTVQGLYECLIENSVGKAVKYFNVEYHPKSKY
jgi:hypothetical protein